MSVRDSEDMFRGSGFWARRSRCQKVAILMIPTLVIVVVIIALCCIFLLKSESTVCESATCHEEAKQLIANMNPGADACEDFYEFACGHYDKTHKLAPDKDRLATFDSVADSVLDRLKLIYATPIDERSVKPLKFIRQFYQTCTRNHTDVDSLNRMLRYMGGWPIAGIPATGQTSGWESALLTVVAEYGESIIVSVSVGPNPYDTTNYAMTVCKLV